MDIIVAKNCGFCYGVKRALKMARSIRSRSAGKVFTLGDLIHNPRVISELEKRGIHSVDAVDRVEGGTVIIRSHGVPPQVIKKLQKKKVEIVDATCPIVKKIQRLVDRLSRKNRELIIVGNREHPEIKGLMGYSRGKGIIIEDETQVEGLPWRKKRAVLAQSTQDIFLFSRVVAALIERTESLDVHNTICLYTQARQKSTSELASHVDVLLIIGGKNSSNTRQLYEISKRILPSTHLIESANQINPRMLRRAKRIGLSGGASTPPEAIEEVVARIQRDFERQCQS
ncbi:MAG: 4-hydroxy-3-methylbut-2-enyl diphosphate reductase, partial [Candidatus Aminicenantes bacterium]|nr:4-hydroxy-3-methylbut-2-enyl diphosphate reductase [Candidatus Aminicenantes bacterium]